MWSKNVCSETLWEGESIMKSKGVKIFVIIFSIVLVAIGVIYVYIANNFIKLETWYFTFGVQNNIIIVDYYDDDVTCKFKSERGFFFGEGHREDKEIEVKVGQEVSWQYWDYNGEGSLQEGECVYVTITLLKSSKVVGYAILEITERDKGSESYQAEILIQKTLLFPISENDAEQKIKL